MTKEYTQIKHRQKEIENLFARYFLMGDYELGNLIDDLTLIELEERGAYLEEHPGVVNGDFVGLWFKFSEDDTLSTTIRNIEIDLSFPSSHGNKDFMETSMQEGIGGQLRVFIS